MNQAAMFRGLRAVARFALPQNMREVLAYGPITFLAVFVGYFALVDRNPIVSAASEVVTPEVPQGGNFTIRYSVNWRDRCRVTGFRVIIDGVGFQHRVVPDTRFVQAGQNDFDITLPIPLAASPGEAVYTGVIEYECNWYQRIFPLEREIAPRTFVITSSGRIDDPMELGRRFCAPALRSASVRE